MSEGLLDETARNTEEYLSGLEAKVAAQSAALEKARQAKNALDEAWDPKEMYYDLQGVNRAHRLIAEALDEIDRAVKVGQ